MERYQIIIAYDGTRFAGSQRQANKRTIQGELEAALRNLGWSGKSVLMAGRTDTGVHAEGQVAAFDLSWRHTSDDLCQALNARLPEDLAVQQVGVAPADFHPRFSATSRVYRYRIYSQPQRDPLRDRYAWRIWPSLSKQKLIPLAAIWPGRHDFSAFGTPPRPESHAIRTVFQAEWQFKEDESLFVIEADAFLYRMVRRLVHVQVAVGQDRLNGADLRDALEHSTALKAGLAPPNGLTLMKVRYASIESEDNLAE